jgi:hypothetical protein
MRFAVGLLIAGFVTACAPSSGDNFSLEQKVAILDAGHFVSEEEVSVKRIRFLLDSLHAATGYP